MFGYMKTIPINSHPFLSDSLRSMPVPSNPVHSLVIG